MRIPTTAIGLLAAGLLAGCGSEADAGVAPTGVPRGKQAADRPAGPEPAAVRGRGHHFDLEVVATGLRQPNQVVPRRGDDRLYVVEQAGTVRLVADGAVARRPFLDLTDRVRSGGELGLLSVAFTPDGRRIVALYTDDERDTRVVAYPAGTDAADRERGEELLAVDQPYENHKGGTVLFDERGRLLVSLGDGGGAFDPEDRGQDPADRLGGILRLEHGRWRTVAFGLRNPWRMAFDDETGLLWVGDVGQDRMEEIDAFYPAEEGTRLPNLGWAAYEGHLPLGAKELAAGSGRLTWPVAAYAHERGHCSVTAGFVYRGAQIERLRGRYVYGDFCRGTIWTLRAAAGRDDAPDPDVRRERARLPGLSSFGRDNDGELYAVSVEGTISRVISPTIRAT